MKTWMTRAFTAALAVFVLGGCGDDDPERPGPRTEPAGVFTGASDCKLFAKDDPVRQDHGYLVWSYDLDAGLLRVDHFNAGLNCCPEYTASIAVAGDRLVITETETVGLCGCLCLFDLGFEVSDLPADVYEVTVVEEYLAPEDPPLTGTIDLTQAAFGTISAPRSRYPWNVPE